MKLLLKIVLVVTLLSGAYGTPYGGAVAHASTIQLPQTGQTVCYDAAYAPTACANTTGQDGNMLAGKPWPVPRFTVNKLGDGITEDGTVTDNLTGLIWLKNANCFGALDWPTALTKANTLVGDNTQCSLNDGSVAGDWRLPNITELDSLVDAQRSNPTLPTGHPFAGVSNKYWSSSTNIFYANTSWMVDMIHDSISGIYSGSVFYEYKFVPLYVWPVRAGQ
jgi:hypothetical protein